VLGGLTNDTNAQPKAADQRPVAHFGTPQPAPTCSRSPPTLARSGAKSGATTRRSG
jgi:hypothetical protein